MFVKKRLMIAFKFHKIRRFMGVGGNPRVSKGGMFNDKFPASAFAWDSVVNGSNMSGIKVRLPIILLLTFVVCGQVFAQEKNSEEKKINFGFTKNPASRAKKTAGNNQQINPSEPKNQNSTNTKKETEIASRSAAQKTLDVAKRASLANLPPTEIYRVGISDVLFISLQNAPAKSSTYFTVLNDGSIDYPLAGGMVSVGGLTVEEIEELLRSKISLYENPQVAVKVREYASHAITVLGLVENAGEKFIQREAVPLFVVKAESIVKPNADQAVIRRENADLETVNLKEAKADEILILPGDIVEFRNSVSSKNQNEPQFFYIGGNIISPGRKDFFAGMTLTQAILASGGLRKSGAKSLLIRSKNEKDLLETKQFNLKDIKNGKIPDPTLSAGDTIEIND